MYLSIHFNGFNNISRGTETLIHPTPGNSNHAADKALAQRIQRAAFNALKSHDPNAKNRGVKNQKLGVLKQASLGTKARGCMIEGSSLMCRRSKRFNLGPNAPEVRSDVCKAIAGALIEDLLANS